MSKVILNYSQVIKTLQFAVFALVLSAFSNHVSAAEIVNINTADAPTLQMIPGIGLDKSTRIIALRKKNEGFSSFDELLKVKGIGAKTLVTIKQHSSLDSGISVLPEGYKKSKSKKSAKLKDA
ncbi:MAG: competence ComEA-like helix-hairpin-helix protein [Saprospiraceae bacterium]|jgi:competence ComEA-like helix-hairpin-helix protein